jgi:hypothetical protein
MSHRCVTGFLLLGATKKSMCSSRVFQTSYNVPAVYDGLTARIRALRSKDQGRQTVPEQRRGNGA